MSESSYSFILSRLLSLGKFVNHDFNTLSIISGLPYLSSNLVHNLSNPRLGLFTFADLMLIACLLEVALTISLTNQVVRTR